MNTVIISGNLTRDVETRYTPSGSAVGQFGIASNRKWKDQQTGEMKEAVTFVDVTVWGKQAETVAQYFRKGSKILITGRLELDSWDGKKTGEKRSKLKIVMESFEFMGGKSDGQSAPKGPDRSTADVPLPGANPGTTADPGDDVPFASTPRSFDWRKLQ